VINTVIDVSLILVIHLYGKGLCGSMSYLVGLPNNSCKPITPGFVNYKKGCTRLAAASDKVYQLLAHGWWFSPGTPASSTTKIGRHYDDIAGILLKVVLKYKKSKIKSNHLYGDIFCSV